MKRSRVLFNLILMVTLLLGIACKTTEEKKKRKLATSMRFHLETNADGTPHNRPVTVSRSNPTLVNIQLAPVLDEGYMEKAELVDVDRNGSWAIKITFDSQGRLRLENLTTTYKGRRVAIFAQWKDARWLGAPVIARRITDGVFIFTPDASKEEAEVIVHGLNNMIKKLKRPYVF